MTIETGRRRESAHPSGQKGVRYWLTHASTITISRVAAMALSAVAGVIVARELGPDKIGQSAIVLGAVAMSNVLIGAVQVPALIYAYKSLPSLAEKHELTAQSFALRLAIAIGIALAVPVSLCLLYTSDAIGIIAWYVVPLVLLNACSPLWLFQAIEKQGVQSVIAVLGPAISAILVATIISKDSLVGIDIWITLVSICAVTLVSWCWLFITYVDPRAPLRLYRDALVFTILRRSTWLTISSVCGFIYLTFDEQIVGYLSSLEELGKYRSAKIVADALNSFFSISSVLLFPRFIEWRSNAEGQFIDRIKRIAAIHAAFALAVAIVAALCVPRLHPMIFGDAYAEAAVPLVILICGKCVVLVSNVFSWALLSNPVHYRGVALTMMTSSVLSVSLNCLMVPRFGMMAAAVSVACCESINLVSYYMQLRRAQPIAGSARMLKS